MKRHRVLAASLNEVGRFAHCSRPEKNGISLLRDRGSCETCSADSGLRFGRRTDSVGAGVIE